MPWPPCPRAPRRGREQRIPPLPATAGSDVRPATARAHRLRDGGEVGSPELFGKRRQDVVPDRCEAAYELREACRPRHEPPVKVLAAIPPATYVDAPYPRNGSDGPLDPRLKQPQLRRQFVGQVARLSEVSARLQERDDRQPGGVEGRAKTPPVRCPDVIAVRRGACMTSRATFAGAWSFSIERWPQRPGAHLAVERECFPLLHWRHAQVAGDSRVELLGGFGHRRPCYFGRK